MTRLAGRYELQRRLAEGGMAEVWLATAHGDAGFTRRVAIKQLFARDDDGGAFERMFLDEARITSRLHHASIVSILDFGVEAGRPFQVLELIDGFDAWRLAKWGRATGAPMPQALALHVCAVVGHALHFAHVATGDDGAPLRIVHRDVSPQNVLVSRSGDVKLSDFGIAIAEGRVEKTVGGVARGKPAYMAPEQAIRGPLDGRTDVFALGCVLHALLTGDSALRDENALVDLLAGQELRLSSELSEETRAVIAKATRRNKAERYENAEAMAVACEALSAEADQRALAAWVAKVAPSPEAMLATPGSGSSPSPAPAGEGRGEGKSARSLRSLGLVVAVAAALGVGGAAIISSQMNSGSDAKDGANGANANSAKTDEVNGGANVPNANNGANAANETSPHPNPLPQGREREKVPTATLKPVTPAQPKSVGVLSIGGEKFLRGEVKIDGISRGFAPANFELPIGPHQLDVMTPDGLHHAKSVTITRLNTPSAPLVWVE